MGFERIFCLLCGGVVSYSENDEGRYKNHLKKEHNVFFFMPWIIAKSIEEYKKSSNNNTIENDTNRTKFVKFQFRKASRSKPSNVSVTITNIETGEVFMPTHDVSKEESVGNESYMTENDENGEETFSENEEKFENVEIYLNEGQDHSVMDINTDNESLTEQETLVDDSNKDSKFEEQESINDENVEDLTPGNAAPDPLTSNGSYCYKCDKSFTKRIVLEEHLKTCDGVCKEKFDIKSYETELQQDEMQIKNKVMGPNSGKIRKKTKKKYKDIVKRKLNCEMCSSVFGTRKGINKHMKTHKGEKPYPCEVCLKSFASSWHLKRHRINHQ